MHTSTSILDNARINASGAQRDTMWLCGWSEGTYRMDPAAFRPTVNYHSWPLLRFLELTSTARTYADYKAKNDKRHPMII